MANCTAPMPNSTLSPLESSSLSGNICHFLSLWWKLREISPLEPTKKPLQLGVMHLGVLICYESIFPEIAHASVLAGANLLVNMTNDAWYGRSSAPYQSLAMAVFRAVENKRSLIRSANTGISGFIDPLGRVISQTAIFEEDALVARVPMVDIMTVFNKQGFRFGSASALALAFLIVLRGRRDN